MQGYRRLDTRSRAIKWSRRGSFSCGSVLYFLKYNDIRASAPGIGRLLFDYLEANPIPADVIVAVPLHKRRERERGYNQSELVARELGKLIGVQVDSKVLRRVKNTSPQVSMEDREDRSRNIQDAFVCKTDLDGKRVLLIDDVATTGATLVACASALKLCGASSVCGLTVARQG